MGRGLDKMKMELARKNFAGNYENGENFALELDVIHKMNIINYNL